MKKYTSIEEQVIFGLESIDPDRKIEVSLKDLMYVHQAIGEWIRYLHQPSHYRNIKDLEAFLGSVKEDNGFKVLHEAYYNKLRAMVPLDIEEQFGEGDVFDNPNLPFYFKMNRQNAT